LLFIGCEQAPEEEHFLDLNINEDMVRVNIDCDGKVIVDVDGKQKKIDLDQFQLEIK
jgi:hypothetical protein